MSNLLFVYLYLVSIQFLLPNPEEERMAYVFFSSLPATLTLARMMNSSTKNSSLNDLSICTAEKVANPMIDRAILISKLLYYLSG